MTRKPWATSNRRSQLPPNWAELRIAVLERDHWRCVECGRPATDVDHRVRGNDHSLGNLQSLCTHHHRAKTAAEGVEARMQKPRRRPPEQHPGIIDDTRDPRGVTPSGDRKTHRSA